MLLPAAAPDLASEAVGCCCWLVVSCVDAWLERPKLFLRTAKGLACGGAARGPETASGAAGPQVRSRALAARSAAGCRSRVQSRHATSCGHGSPLPPCCKAPKDHAACCDFSHYELEHQCINGIKHLWQYTRGGRHRPAPPRLCGWTPEQIARRGTVGGGKQCLHGHGRGAARKAPRGLNFQTPRHAQQGKGKRLNTTKLWATCLRYRNAMTRSHLMEP